MYIGSVNVFIDIILMLNSAMTSYCLQCNRKRIVDYPNLWAYTRELYQIPAFKETTNFEHIAKFYQVSRVHC